MNHVCYRKPTNGCKREQFDNRVITTRFDMVVPYNELDLDLEPPRDINDLFDMLVAADVLFHFQPLYSIFLMDNYGSG